MRYPVDLIDPLSVKMIIHAISAFEDNIIWGIEVDRSLIVVDPGDATPVLEFISAHGLTCRAILITHHHADHTGGLAELQKRASFIAHQATPIEVYGPSACQSLGVNQPVMEGSILRPWACELSLEVIDCPGHTADHIAYLVRMPEHPPLLFCGDTLFAAGCGRLLGGTAAQLFESLRKFSHLPPETKVYCAHEYTLNNLLFAAQAMPGNQAIRARLIQVRQQRAAGERTLPSSIGLEQDTNPFLLCHDLNEFIALRSAKDQFRPSST